MRTQSPEPRIPSPRSDMAPWRMSLAATLAARGGGGVRSVRSVRRACRGGGVRLEGEALGS